jgi:hypothetical protein
MGMSRRSKLSTRPPALGLTPCAAAVQQRSDHDAAHHQLSVDRYLIDITGAARTVSSQYYLPFEALLITAGLFCYA